MFKIIILVICVVCNYEFSFGSELQVEEELQIRKVIADKAKDLEKMELSPFFSPNLNKQLLKYDITKKQFYIINYIDVCIRYFGNRERVLDCAEIVCSYNNKKNCSDVELVPYLQLIEKVESRNSFK